jgi:hypothetical protein
MIGALVFAAALTARAAPDTLHVVRVAANGRAEALAALPPTIADGDAVWTWSAACAPTRDAERRCDASRAIAIHVQLPRGQKPPVTIRWGSDEMVRTIPDRLLPDVTTDDAGNARVVAPDGKLFARIVSDGAGSEWLPLDRTSVTLTARPAVRMAARIVDDRGDRVASAQVRIAASSLIANDEPPIFVTAEKGVATVAGIPATLVARIAATSDELAPTTLVAPASRLPATIVLHAGAELRGIVTAARKPLALVALTATFLQEGALATRRVTSAADGRFRIAGLPAGRVELTATRSGFPPASTVTDVAAEEPRVVALALSAGRRLTVRVTASNGTPIHNATLRIGGSPLRARSDAAGFAQLDDAPSAGEVEASAAGYRTSRRPIPRIAGAPLAIVLQRAASVTFRIVRKSDGASVTGGNALVGIDGNERLTPLDPSGETRLDDLTAGALTLELRPEGLLPLRLPPHDLDAGEQLDLGQLVADDGITATGRIVDADLHDAIAGARVRLYRPNDFGPSRSLVMHDWLDTTSGDDGRFRIGGLTPGNWTAVIEAAGRARETRTLAIADNDAHLSDAGTIALAAGKTLVVHCAPLSRCGSDVRLLGADTKLEWAGVAAPLNGGDATLAPVASGAHVLRLSSERGVIWERSVTIDADRDVTELTIRVPSITIEGAVTARGHAADGGEVVFVRATDHLITIAQQTPAGTMFRQNLGTFSAGVAAPVSAGHFLLTDVVPGRYSVTYESTNGRSVPRTIIIPDDVDRYRVDLSVSAGDLAGVVQDSAGRPASRALIRAERSEELIAATVANTDGTFVLNGLGTGAVTIRASAAGAAARETVTLDDARRDVVLTLR